MKHKWLLYPMVVMGALLIALLGMTPHANSSPMADVAEAGHSASPEVAPTLNVDEQANVMLRGRVVPAQAKLIVELLSISADGRVLDVTRTDENGWYSFAPLPSGAYQLRVLDQDKQELVLAAGGQIAVRPHDPHDREVEHTLSLAQSATGDVMRQNERERAEGATLASASEDARGGSEGYVTGKVTASGTGEALGFLQVRAFYDYQDNPDYPAQTGYTDSSGVYTLTLFAGSSYRVEFSSSGQYVGQWYNNKPSYATADSIQVEENVVIREINAELEVGGQITGAVTAVDGSTPLQGTSVRAYDSINSTSSVASAYTDESGVYTLTGLATGNYYLEFRGPSDSPYVTEYYNDQPTLATANPVAVEVGQNVVDINAALETGGTINGTVTAVQGGAPLENVYVYAYDSTSSNSYVASGRTDASGVYTVTTLATGSYYLKFEGPYNSAYLDEYYNDQQTLAAADAVSVQLAQTVGGIDVALETGGTINGTVTAVVDGTPIEQVSVYVYADTTSTSSVANGYTQADGTYEIVGLPAGTYYLKFEGRYDSVYLDEYYNEASTLAEADPVTVQINSAQTIDAALETGGTINGTVTAVVDGTPIEDVSVTVYTDTTSTSSVAYGRTEADGTYQIVGLPAGTYYFEFRAPYNSVYLDEYYNNQSTLAEADPVSVQLNSVQTIDVGLETGGTLSGVVTAQTDGRVIEDVGIEIYTDTTSIRAIEYASTDESGAYEITGLPAGNYYMKFRAPYDSIYMDEYYNEASTLATADPVNVPLNTVVPVDAALGMAGVVIGRVTAADTGLPLEDVGVSLYDRQCAEERYDTRLDYAYTDASGVYTLTTETTGSYDLLFAPSSDSPARAYFDTRNDGVAVTVGNVSESDAVLERGGQIMGQLTAADSGDPLADVYVYVYTYDADNDDYEYHGSAYTNASGVYSSTALTTNNYRLRFDPGSLGASAAYFSEYYNDQTELSSANDVSVTTGDITSNINAVLARGGQITGRLTAEDSGDPLENVRVRVYDADGWDIGYANTNRNGVYTTSGVPTGNYRLRFETPTWADHYDSADYIWEDFDSVAVTVGSTTPNIDAELTRGGSITGKVTAEDTGTPLRYLLVVAYDSNRNRVSASNTDSRGEYNLPGLPPGSNIVYFDNQSKIIDCLRVEYDGIYYNQKPDFASADPVSLSGTETVENINAVLSRNNGQPPSDTTAPTLTMPDDMRVDAPDSNGVVVEFTVTASDNSDPNPTVVCTPASGSTFPVGSTTVTCTATDASGNQASRSFTISVIDSSVPPDTTAPTMAMPDEMTIAATSSSGTVVNYQVTASDDTDPNPTVVCEPAPGSLFPMGSTTVECTVTDASGNQSNDSFTITVVEAGYQIHLPLVIRP